MSKTIARNGAADLDPQSINYAEIADPGHGNTTAGWTGVVIMLIGAIIGAYGATVHNHTIVYISVAIVVVGLIVGFVLRLAGFGGGNRAKRRQ